MPPKKSEQKLKSIKPSGKRDESFFELVFEVVRQVPKGRVTSYGAVAAALGAKMSARMVGWAMNSAHRIKPPVPAHRVVNRMGLLSGKMHFATPERMQEFLPFRFCWCVFRPIAQWLRADHLFTTYCLFLRRSAYLRQLR